MDLIEGLGITPLKVIYPSEELLIVRPIDPRAWHCTTVEEYRLFKFSSSYRGYGNGVSDMSDNYSVDFSDHLE